MFRRLHEHGFDIQGGLDKFNSLNKLELFELYRLYRTQWSRWCPSSYKNSETWRKEKWKFSKPLKRPHEYSLEALRTEIIEELMSLMDYYEYDGKITMIPDFVLDTFRLYIE